MGFIVKAVCTLKDRAYLYFCTELVTGGELYDVMRALGLLTTYQAQFYTGSLLLALNSLHIRKIVYRDLKPENVLIDSVGYIKLIDFGCSVKLRGLTFTLVGTPHYMAPEVILGDGYDTTCDIWTLGVCLFEFLCGPLPYGESKTDPYSIFIEILTEHLKIPVHVKSSSAELLRQLLLRSSEQRPKYSAVRVHRFFSQFSFDRLLHKSLPAPFVPEPAQLLTPTDFESAGFFEQDEEDTQTDNGWDQAF